MAWTRELETYKYNLAKSIISEYADLERLPSYEKYPYFIILNVIPFYGTYRDMTRDRYELIVLASPITHKNDSSTVMLWYEGLSWKRLVNLYLETNHFSYSSFVSIKNKETYSRGFDSTCKAPSPQKKERLYSSSRRCMCMGTEYPCLAAAAKALNMVSGTLAYRVKSTDSKWSDWYFID